jgi:hypothetical protein
MEVNGVFSKQTVKSRKPDYTLAKAEKKYPGINSAKLSIQPR